MFDPNALIRYMIGRVARAGILFLLIVGLIGGLGYTIGRSLTAHAASMAETAATLATQAMPATMLSAQVNDYVIVAGTNRPIQTASITTASLTPANTVQTIVAAVPGKKIRVLWIVFSSTTAAAPATGEYVSNTTRLFYLGGFGGGATPNPLMRFPGVGHLAETATGELFGFRNTAGVMGDVTNTVGYVTY